MLRLGVRWVVGPRAMLIDFSECSSCAEGNFHPWVIHPWGMSRELGPGAWTKDCNRRRTEAAQAEYSELTERISITMIYASVS